MAAAVWDEDGMPAELREYAVEHLGNEDWHLIVDEAGDLKTGIHAVGVQASTPAPRAGSRMLGSRAT
jgi:SRSO17 transposase